MASCTRVDSMLQGYVDGALGQSDRVILEEHLAQCGDCRDLLRKQQRTSAMLFESFAPYRLHRTLRQSVLDHLPELESLPTDLVGLNLRTKHPMTRWAMVARRVPAAAALVLLFLAVVLWLNSPEPLSQPDHLGTVTHIAGEVSYFAPESTERQGVALAAPVQPGQLYKTGAAASLMLSLRGPTQVKLNENTLIKVADARKLTVMSGEVWLDVGSDGRLFKIQTPMMGEITVFGTAFAIKVNSDLMTVTVQRGKVQVENVDNFVMVKPGQQVRVAAGEAPARPVAADVDAVVAWADRIVEDKEAARVFKQTILAESAATELRGNAAFYIETKQDGRVWSVSALRFNWEPDSRPSGHCSYDVYVYDGAMNPVLKHRIPGSVFGDPTKGSYTIPITTGPLANTQILWVLLKPDYATGATEMSFSGCVGAGIMTAGREKGTDIE